MRGGGQGGQDGPESPSALADGELLIFTQKRRERPSGAGKWASEVERWETAERKRTGARFCKISRWEPGPSTSPLNPSRAETLKTH